MGCASMRRQAAAEQAEQEVIAAARELASKVVLRQVARNLRRAARPRMDIFAPQRWRA